MTHTDPAPHCTVCYPPKTSDPDSDVITTSFELVNDHPRHDAGGIAPDLNSEKQEGE